MKLKSMIRQMLLAPIWPRVFIVALSALRFLGLLPKRVQGKWPPQRILLVNITGNLGDALMMLPLVDALQDALPGAAVDLLVESPMDAPLRAVPFVRRVYCFDRDKKNFPLFWYYQRIYRMVSFARRELMGEPYDLALLPRWGTDPSLSSYLAAMSTASRRCGHNPEEDKTAESVLPGMAALLTNVSHGGEGLAEGVREQLLLLACGLKKEFDPASEERRPVQSVMEMGRSVDISACMRRLGISMEQPFMLLAPGASHPVRCWPTERFSALGMALRRKTGIAVYSLGGAADRTLSERIEALSGGAIRSLAGQTSILEAIALTQRAVLLVSNDSGPVHVGGSVGISTLVLSACPKTSTREHANSPLRVRPVGPMVRILQPEKFADGCDERCHASVAHCILGLTVESVLCEAEQLLLVL
jgi:ADP-heptose:LPS heptosyltransferase